MGDLSWFGKDVSHWFDDYSLFWSQQFPAGSAGLRPWLHVQNTEGQWGISRTINGAVEQLAVMVEDVQRTQDGAEHWYGRMVTDVLAWTDENGLEYTEYEIGTDDPVVWYRVTNTDGHWGHGRRVSEAMAMLDIVVGYSAMPTTRCHGDPVDVCSHGGCLALVYSMGDRCITHQRWCQICCLYPSLILGEGDAAAISFHVCVRCWYTSSDQRDPAIHNGPMADVYFESRVTRVIEQREPGSSRWIGRQRDGSWSTVSTGA